MEILEKLFTIGKLEVPVFRELVDSDEHAYRITTFVITPKIQVRVVKTLRPDEGFTTANGFKSSLDESLEVALLYCGDLVSYENLLVGESDNTYFEPLNHGCWHYMTDDETKDIVRLVSDFVLSK